MLLQQNIPDGRSSDLADKVSRYLAAGGQIETLPGFGAVKPKPPAKVCPKINLVYTVRRYARQGYSPRYTGMVVGLSKWQLAELARNHGIKFRPDPTKINRI
jgi:hypothetical protein